MVRELDACQIEETVRELCIRACRELPCDIEQRMKEAAGEEDWDGARSILELLLENARVAREHAVPICQDTGMAVVFCEIGQDVHISGSFEEAVLRGVRRGYTEGYLRKSVVADPLRRKNTGDNTPPVIHLRLVPGDRVRLTVAPKGAGSENMSRMTMLTPAQGLEGVRQFVMETVRLAGANPCPPMILGIGIGGNFERAPEMAKEAMLDPPDTWNPDPFYAELEKEWLRQINETGIGPQGLGGRTTCLGLHIHQEATHIACLPVAVNVGCHVTRHATAVL